MQIFKKALLSFFFFFPFILLTSCQPKGVQTLDLAAAKKLLSASNDYQLVDVRSASEYESGHLKGAVNMDVNASDFETNIAKLIKEKAVIVYCFSGSRSASAAGVLSDNGFKTVYDIPGIMSWRNDGAELETQSNVAKANGMSVDDFNKLIQSKEFVLIDFNATWCKPCKIMAPYLEKAAEARKDKILLAPMDADANPELVQANAIDALPTIMLYQNGKLIWRSTGLLEEDTLNNELNLRVK